MVRNFAELGALGAVCDSNPDVVLEVSSQYGVPALSVDDIKESSLKGCVIATGACYHEAIGAEMLMAGKHVFVEKPMALSLRDSRKFCDVAKKSGRILMVGHVLRYHPAFIKLLEIISAGDIGRVVYISSSRIGFGKLREKENAMWSLAPHDVSMILAICKRMPEKIFAHGVGSRGAEGCGLICMQFPGGLSAVVNSSWIHPKKEHRLIVIGERGAIEFDDTAPWEEKLAIYRNQLHLGGQTPYIINGAKEFIECERKEPLKEECAHFIECIRNNSSALTDSEDGVRVARVLEASNASIAVKEWVDLSQEKGFWAHSSVKIDDGVDIGIGTKIWHFSHVLSNTSIGADCNIGQNVVIGPSVRIGSGCKIQNNVSVYRGVSLGNNVFCGPSCVFTNVKNPRADVSRKDEFLSTVVEDGVTIGANATIVCGVKLGRYCFVGAGAVVTKDVKPHSMVVGNPARHICWVSHSGERLDDNDMVCPREGRKYRVAPDGELEEVVVHRIVAKA
ncbi:oxidoreductase [Candidatus Hydrogenosomobacter endosymbioticus]|uniref:Oxidoreductase n=1 Tax=Candidatus Hydrogenosomobacter endosymbioticus TaxID=2558174 RepID=A0ABM7V948_9PROT|nr:oxidoreductase [Candidatus Hydrogenosomobacter endosymbioticus]